MLAAGATLAPRRGGAQRARAAAGRAATPAAPTPPLDLTTAVTNEIAIVTFLGGGAPLTPAERQQVADAVADGMRRDAACWSNNSRAWMAALAEAARDPQYATETRESQRAALELSPLTPANALERAVVGAHDPAVLVDAAHKRIVTEQSLAALQQAAAVTARAAGVPGPDATFAEAARRGVRAEWARLLPAQSNGLALAATNAPYAPAFFKAAPKAAVAKLLTDVRQDVLAGRDDADRQWRLALATAPVSEGGRTYVQRQKVYSFMAMNQMMFGQMMQTQQRNNAHASRGEAFQTTPY